MRRRVLGFISAVACVFLFGAAEPASTLTGKVKLQDFESETDVLLGYPDGQVPLEWYQRTGNTAHIIGPPINQYPPSPCRGLAIAWNRLAERSSSRDKSHVAFGNILARMATHQCSAVIVRDTESDPREVLRIHPTP